MPVWTRYFLFFIGFLGSILHNLTLPSQRLFRITYCTYLSQSRASPTPSPIACVGSQTTKLTTTHGVRETREVILSTHTSPAPRSCPLLPYILFFPPPSRLPSNTPACSVGLGSSLSCARRRKICSEPLGRMRERAPKSGVS